MSEAPLGSVNVKAKVWLVPLPLEGVTETGERVGAGAPGTVHVPACDQPLSSVAFFTSI
jgi:hypothetical protein